MKEELLKRGKSFAWRFGGMALVALLAFISSNLDLLKLSPEVVGLIGLIVGEITKSINSYFELEQAIGRAVKRLAGRG